MKKIILLAFCFISIYATCKHHSSKKELTWIQKTIVNNEKLPARQSIIRIQEGKFNDQTVYYVTPPCCDQLNILYNEKGEILCYPDGGMINRPDSKCPDFKTQFKGKTIWERKQD